MSISYFAAARANRSAAWLVLAVFVLHLPGVPTAWAGPTGEQVIQGEATFARDGNSTLIETGTDQTIIEYDNFDILVDELVHIDQPNAHSRILNRIPFGAATQIDGELTSNGIVYILNPAGVFAGDTAIIDVGGLVAGAGDIANEDFLAGRDALTLSGDVFIAEGAEIRANDSIALIGRRIQNFGTIESRNGYVAFVAGDQAVLSELDGHLVIRIDSGNPDPNDFALTQAGSVSGQRVSLTAGDTYSLALNHTGITRGRDIELRAEGDDGLVEVAGTLDARGSKDTPDGGSIAILGGKIALLDAELDASGENGGNIRVGGDVQGGDALPTARRVFVSREAVLNADAGTRGDGGSVVVWSDEKTGFYGRVLARGGSDAGDGGFAEISSHRSLETSGHAVDLSATAGATGTLLYDPDAIEIRGGAAPTDGSDVNNDPLLVASTGGAAGRILNGEVGDGSDPFVIYESEIEGTDANIELVATTQIGVAGDFDANDVVIQSGNDLTLRTVGDGPSSGSAAIDLTDDGRLDTLRWIVSEGGTIFISTASGTATGSGVDADIRVGELEFAGRAFTGSIPNVQVGRSTNRTPVELETRQGDITVARIIANGDDSRTETSAGTTTHFSPTAAGAVTISAAAGNLDIGEIQANGGNASAASPDVGRDGGAIQLSTGSGEVFVRGPITTNGGIGAAGTIDSDGEDIAIAGSGGRGGAILISAASLDGENQVRIEGNLSANGGNGTETVVTEIEGEPVRLQTNGGEGGQIQLTGDRIEATGTDAANPLVWQANGGSGTSRGGFATSQRSPAVPSSALPSTPGAAINLLANSSSATDGAGNIELTNTEIQARGGDAGLAAGAGGSGGFGGDVLLNSNSGSVLTTNVSIDASGGDGASLESGDETPLGTGGSAQIIVIEANDLAEAPNILASGGSGTRGDGGSGASVTVNAGTGGATLRDVDISGGDVAENEDGEFAGGLGGSLFVNANDPDGNTAIRIEGGVGGIGGFSADTGDRASGAAIRIDSDGTIESTGGAVAAFATNLIATTIGTDDNPVRVAGTPAGDDVATVTATGDFFVEVANGIDLGGRVSNGLLDTLDLNQNAIDGNASVVRDGVDIVEVTAVDIGDATEGREIITFGAGSAADPRLNFRYQLSDSSIAPPNLQVARGAGNLGVNGGLLSSDGAIIGEAAGSGAHITSQGDLQLEGSSIGSSATPLALAGAPNAALTFSADGNIDANVITAFGAYDIAQGAISGDTTIIGAADIDIDGDETTSRIVRAATGTANFVYDTTRTAETVANTNIQITSLDVGGDSARIISPGDIVLDAPAAASETIRLSNGADLALETTAGGDGSVIATTPGADAVHVRMLDGDINNPNALLLLAAGSVGTDSAPLVTDGVQEIAARFGDGLHLSNTGGDLTITAVDNFDPGDLDPDEETQGPGFFGVISVGRTGDTVLANPDGQILLGAIPVTEAEIDVGATHVASSGDLVLDADAIEISNAQFVEVTEDDETTLEAHHSARLFATNDIVIRGTIDSDPTAVAIDNRNDVDPSELVPDEAIAATLTLATQRGQIEYGDDVGTNGAFAVIDSGNTRLLEDRTFNAEELRFRGTLDGPGSVTAGFEGGDAQRVAFGGAVGGNEAIGGLDIAAEQIDFAVDGRSASQLRVDGDVLLDTTPGATGAAATLANDTGSLTIDATGDILIGDQDKLAAVGDVVLRSDTLVRVGDITADRIVLSAPTIELVRRAPGPLEQPNGDSAGMDAGSDLVANEIILTQAPTLVGIGATPTFFVGDGGVSLAGGLNGIDVRRLNASLGAVKPAALLAEDGRVLDLTGSGPPIVANPTRQMYRPDPLDLPTDVPHVGADAPAAAPPLPAPAVLAYLRCGGEPGDACDAEALRSVSAFDHSALSTARALEVTQRYRELVNAPGAPERLRSEFASAADAFANSDEASAPMDGAAFYRYLDATGNPAARSLRELSWLFTQIELLGMSDADTQRLKRGIAEEFANATGLAELTDETIEAAIAATPIGIPNSPR